MKKEIKNKKDLNKMEIWIIVIVLIIFLGCLYLIFFSNLGGEKDIDLSNLPNPTETPVTGNVVFPDGPKSPVVPDDVSGDSSGDSVTCSNLCVSGSSECEGNGFKNCSDLDSDGCTEWSSVVNCGNGEICFEGVCVSPCVNQCSPSGRKTCDGNGYKTCGNIDSDSCLEWSSITSCGSGQICSSGICVDETSACSNECDFQGIKMCSGSGYKTCGDYDGDSCTEWSSVVGCGNNEECTNGACVIVQLNCISDCLDGAKECLQDGGYRVCGNYNEDDCLEWNSSLACSSDEECLLGECVDIVEFIPNVNSETISSLQFNKSKGEIKLNEAILVKINAPIDVLSSFNISRVSIKKNSTLNKNYILFDTNQNYLNKTLYINGSGFDSVCIVDDVVNNVNDVFLGCDYLVCPGVLGNYNCSIEGDLFIIKGLSHSGIITMDGNSCGDGICTNDESCADCFEDCGICPTLINPPVGPSPSSGGSSSSNSGGSSNSNNNNNYSIGNNQIPSQSLVSFEDEESDSIDSFNAISNEEYPEENMSLILIIVIIVVILVFVVVVLIIVFLTKKSDLPVANSNNQNQVSTNNIQMQGV